VLRLHDTATGVVRPLELRDPGQASMYVCGLTVNDLPHIGHGRMALVFDVIRRYLVFSGLDVHHVSNVTDIDDRIIDRAVSEGRTEPEVAAEFEGAWWEAIDALGILRPDEAPHATAYVEGMVALVTDLVARGVAYPTSTGVYLDVEKIDGYGLLARQSLDSLRSGARVEVDPEKRSPLDFALWKTAKPGEPTWDSPFGPGRPGWHTECVVMSLDLLGDGFDLHGGAVDLIFPHHENERAQAVAEGRAFARHWVHNGWVMTGTEKMSKSLANFVTIAQLLEGTDSRAYRLLALRSQYRSQMQVTPETIADATSALDRLDRLAERFSVRPQPTLATVAISSDAGDAPDLVAAEVETFRAHMDDDLDTPGALAGIFDAAGRANALGDAGDTDAARALAETVGVLSAVLGIALGGRDSVVMDEETARLVTERDAARASREWGRADDLRDALVERGFVVEDGPNGTTLRR
jgi:cysteinyl-tRNA synthetase